MITAIKSNGKHERASIAIKVKKLVFLNRALTGKSYALGISISSPNEHSNGRVCLVKAMLQWLAKLHVSLMAGSSGLRLHS